MGLVLVVLPAALAVGRLTGGRLDGLGRVPLRSRRLLVMALLVQVAGALVTGLLGGAAYAAGLAASALLVVAFLARNRHLPGSGLVALGLLGNALVVGLNGAMPVSPTAAARAGLTAQSLALDGDPRHETASAATRLPLLGDVVPVPLPLRPEVVSPGDVLVAAGLAQLVVLAMRSAPTAPSPASAPAPASAPGAPTASPPVIVRRIPLR